MANITNIKEDLNRLIYRHGRQIILGASMLILAALFNVSYGFFLRLALSVGIDTFIVQTLFYVFSYSYFIIMAIGIILIAIGFREITDIYFVDHITKAGKSASIWLFIYAGAFLIDIILVGWPLTAGFAGIAILFGRILGFLKLNNVLSKIRDVFKLKVSSFIYIFFAYFAVIVSLLTFLATQVAQDATLEVIIFALNGPIDSVLMIFVGIKILIDISRIKKFIIENKIDPYDTKTSLLIKDRRSTPQPATTKAHLQSKTAIERLQKKSQERTERIESIRKQRKKREKQHKEKEKRKEKDYFNCPKCGKRTDMNLPVCTTCGGNIKELVEKKTRKTETVKSKKIQSKRLISLKKEKLLQQVVIAIFLIAFVTYSFITANTTLIVYSWIIIALFATYIFVNFIPLFFIERGFTITTLFMDLLYLFVILPILNIILTYFILLGFQRGFDISETVYRSLLWSVSLLLYFSSLLVTLQRKIRNTNMNIIEYIKYRFDFKERSKELEKDAMRVEKKRAYFDNLDRVEAHMAKQRKEKVMDYQDFDYKQRIKDLGSPLKNEEKDQKE